MCRHSKQRLMFVGRNFWKSSLLESEKSKISLSSSNAVISLIDLMAYSCAFPFRCFLAFWIAWKRSSRLCIWLFSCLRRASMLAGSSLGNSAERALGTRNPCHRQYTSNSHLFSIVLTMVVLLRWTLLRLYLYLVLWVCQPWCVRRFQDSRTCILAY